jgi:uncharacterized protein (TIGR03000 family)
MPRTLCGWRRLLTIGLALAAVSTATGQAIAQTPDQPATVVVKLPPGAEKATIAFGSHPTTSTGLERRYLSPPLVVGKTYTYTVHAAWKVGDKEVKYMEKVSVSAGKEATVDFTRPIEKDNMPPPGFQALFNGKDLTNWQGLVELPQRKKLNPEELAKKQKEANEKYLPHWTVKDGILVYDGKGQSLQTAKDYGNFELYCDWKIPPKGDSGIYLRGQPQVQIWDSDTLGDNLKADRGKGSGGLWNNPKDSPGQKPLVKADNPIGEWNTFHIIMKGDNVTVILNGKKVVDDAPLANYWEKGKPLPAVGPIELQHHGNTLWLKELPD